MFLPHDMFAMIQIYLPYLLSVILSISGATYSSLSKDLYDKPANGILMYYVSNKL